MSASCITLHDFKQSRKWPHHVVLYCNFNKMKYKVPDSLMLYFWDSWYIQRINLVWPNLCCLHSNNDVFLSLYCNFNKMKYKVPNSLMLYFWDSWYRQELIWYGLISAVSILIMMFFFHYIALNCQHSMDDIHLKQHDWVMLWHSLQQHVSFWKPLLNANIQSTKTQSASEIYRLLNWSVSNCT